jgi:septal ring factor EnvC (AmiA/AmiB activator)
MTNRPLKDVVHSDINYFQKKLNKYVNQQVTLKKEIKELRKNTAQNVDAVIKKLEYLDNLNNTIARHERILGYLKDYVEKEFGDGE